jgi:hypothetical protein
MGGGSAIEAEHASSILFLFDTRGHAKFGCFSICLLRKSRSHSVTTVTTGRFRFNRRLPLPCSYEAENVSNLTFSQRPCAPSLRETVKMSAERSTLAPMGGRVRRPLVVASGAIVTFTFNATRGANVESEHTAATMDVRRIHEACE